MADEHPMRGGGNRPAWNHREARELEEEDQEGGPGENLKRGGRSRRKAGGKTAGDCAPSRMDHRARGGKAKKWISGAIKHPGALHEELGVPKGEKIPAAKIAKAAHSSNPTLAKRARLAQTLKKLH